MNFMIIEGKGEHVDSLIGGNTELWSRSSVIVVTHGDINRSFSISTLKLHGMISISYDLKW